MIDSSRWHGGSWPEHTLVVAPHRSSAAPSDRRIRYTVERPFDGRVCAMRGGPALLECYRDRIISERDIAPVPVPYPAPSLCAVHFCAPFSPSSAY